MNAAAPPVHAGPDWRTRAAAAPRWVDAAAVAALLLEAAVVIAWVRGRLTAPLWYDEQWRAYQLSLTDGFWRQLHHVNTAVAAGWVAIERASVLAFGNNERALRLPQVLALALIGWPTWRLARHWLGVTASAIVAAAMVASAPLLPYAVQLKPYAVEALCCVLALLLWSRATDPDGHSTPTRLAMYAGIGLCMLVATPLVFAVAPLLLLDLARALRSPGAAALRRAGPAALAGGIALAHLVWFVLPQRGGANIATWNLDFVPSSGRLGWLAARLWSFVPGVATGGPARLPGGLHVAAQVLLVAGLTAGTAFALADARARPLLAALYGALAAELAAAALRLWPFGFERVNLFMLPLFYLLAGFGMARLAGLAAAWAGRRAAAARAAGAAALATVLAAAVIGCAGVAWASGSAVGEIHTRAEQRHHAWGDGMRALVEQIRAQAGPRDAAMMVGTMGVKGWSYYLWSYRGSGSGAWARRPMPPDRTLVGDPPAPSSVAAFLAAHRDPVRVFVLTMVNAHPGWKPATADVLAAAGYRPVRATSAVVTGTLTVWERPAAATS